MTKREIGTESDFADAVRRERKRCDRGDGSLLLVLASTSEPTGASLRELAALWLEQVRETDHIAWQHTSLVLGILVTDVNRSARELAAASIRQRLDESLNRIRAGAADGIACSLHFYPADRGDLPLRAGDPFYHDLVVHDRSVRSALAVKRTFDVAIAVTGLLAFAPLLLLIALAVKLSSPGPVLFRQHRLGQSGRAFNFLKFRTMHAGADGRVHKLFVTKLIRGDIESRTLGVYKISSDPRVTRIGRWLRKASLDELPQLWNVLKGDMSVVGPRPPITYEVEQYDRWHRSRVLAVKPGMTGLWQVNGRSRVKFDDMVRLDLRYAREWSLWLDLKILVKTPSVVLSGAGAY